MFVLLACEGLVLGVRPALGLAIAYFMERAFIHDGILMPPAPGLTRQFKVKIEFELVMAISALVLGSVTALLATLFGAAKASSLTISESLRST